MNKPIIIYINSDNLSVCDGGFGGWGRERPVKQRVTKLGNGARGVDEIRYRSGQWEGSGGGELDGCIMHRVHTSNVN
jgi:hypothetical protein